MYFVEFGGHLSQFFGVHNLEQFVPLGPQTSFLRTLGFGHRLAEGFETRILTSPGFNFTGKNHRRCRRAADYGGVSSFQSGYFKILVEGPREDHIRTSVVAGDHAKDDGALEVDDCPANLGAVLQLQPAHRLGRAVEP